MNRLVIIDGHAILHRAYHALPPLTTSKGVQINAVYGFTSMLLRVIENLKPMFLAVCFDLPGKTFRNELSKEYQAKRPKMEEELVGQVDMVHEVVSKMGFAIFEMEGYEADDLIGTIAERSKNGEMEIIIVTGDRDMLQLVDDYTKVYMPVKGLSESKMYGEKEVEEKFGVKAKQVVDLKAIMGDQSDNYGGIPGVGPKSAAKLLNEFGSLDEILDKLGEIKNEKLRKLFEEHKEKAQISKKLAQIVKDAPIEINLEKLRIGNLLRPELVAFFEEMEFRSLIPRLSNRAIKQSSNRAIKQSSNQAIKQPSDQAIKQLSII